ncbi:2-C-methyl-D-erythritol 4-phosphate cytidylyltransferase [Alkaliphilus metalliredigens QYMF]|uniref:2-C-methyl-D-erythritol 4-phosphate cytidylyltransferase n=1 Tax=Alkaliphilus metalliredigens (strain QYMF) TaxID=293826 RepID=ISPD_ALKMQ|nr:2-C-methyl-D-erythritol 4-phosphate cytidylyltransferase [Alkaliphilus metalliredigens]A6TWL0.1 RecName: Full=2-C-methyl-D-erythritol 4-phosphate cytidylyltransferase; AltName: Full=4-diphosphocytidyl-2C-methyl-D-erythritol synthase; AltName: Full=MEP cytidylyltransferase; Short=MCT [Alkaliphilus metalliredigens QYMF]ABR50578.1 2-C-methyl-D-erythritol 4-phosphate cytidylyltransferase [Alkaliphilus metalliredigens QYMF]
MAVASKVTVIVVAAGKGKRMGRSYNKQYIMLENKPILYHTLAVFEKHSEINEIILVVASGEEEYCQGQIIKKYGLKKVRKVVAGGSERRNSVKNGLEELEEACEVVLVHDGARPFITKEVITKSIEVAYEEGAVIVAVPVKDTIKRVNEKMEVVETPERQQLWAVQTPQVFRSGILKRAYKEAEDFERVGTDDAVLVEAAGYTVKVVLGIYENIKVTTPEDLIIGQGILNQRKDGEQCEWE